MRRQSEIMARLYARLREYRDAGRIINDRSFARELVAEMPDIGMSPEQLAEIVATYAANYGVPVELGSR